MFVRSARSSWGPWLNCKLPEALNCSARPLAPCLSFRAAQFRKGESAEQVQRWLEERRRNFPSTANLERKVALNPEPKPAHLASQRAALLPSCTLYKGSAS